MLLPSFCRVFALGHWILFHQLLYPTGIFSRAGTLCITNATDLSLWDIPREGRVENNNRAPRNNRHEEEHGGTRPGRLFEVRPQERDQRRIVEHIVDNTFIVLSLDVPWPQVENQLVEVCRQLDTHVPEQAVEVPKISSSSRLSCRRRVLRLPQTAEQLVEVPTIVSVSSLRALVEQNVDIPVPRGRGGLVGRRDLQGFSKGHCSAAFLGAEHVDIPVPRHGGLQGSRHGQGSAASSFHSRDAADEAFTGFFFFFALFPKEKSVRLGPHLGSELGADISSSTPAAQLEAFFTDAAGGVWMQFPDGRWKLLGSDPDVWWPG